jgi:hypothetical protein
MPPPPPRLTPRQRAFTLPICRATSRWIRLHVMRRLAEHCGDPAECWRRLDAMLRRFEAGEE